MTVAGLVEAECLQNWYLMWEILKIEASVMYGNKYIRTFRSVFLHLEPSLTIYRAFLALMINNFPPKRRQMLQRVDRASKSSLSFNSFQIWSRGRCYHNGSYLFCPAHAQFLLARFSVCKKGCFIFFNL